MLPDSPVDLNGDSVPCGVLEPEEAIELYTQSIEFDPLNATLYELRGRKHRMAGNLAEAAADCKRALELNSPAFLNGAIDNLHINAPNKSNELQNEDDLGQEESETDEDETDEDSFFDEDTLWLTEQESNSETPLTEEEVQQLVDELVQTEIQAAEAQENLEEESLEAMHDKVRAELASKLSGSELDGAVKNEMTTYSELWQDTLDDLEDQSALLQERLDDAGVDLPCLFKLIEKQTQEGCTTEAWKQRVHWAGLAASQEVEDLLNKAERDLEIRKPVKRHRGKLVEEGASGFITKRLALPTDDEECGKQQSESWESLDTFLRSGEDAEKGRLYGSKAWAFVYLASTPEQAASLGLPGADQVEELEDLEKCEKNPFYAAAVANEKQWGLTEQQQRNITKVREEDDIKKARLLQRVTLQRNRIICRSKNPDLSSCPAGLVKAYDRDVTIGSYSEDSVPENRNFTQDLGYGSVEDTSSSFEMHEGQGETTKSGKRRFPHNSEENPSKKRLVMTGDILSIPVIDDEGFVETGSNVPLGKLDSYNGSHELNGNETQTTVINIDSDEEQEPVCFENLGCVQEQNILTKPEDVDIWRNQSIVEVSPVDRSITCCAEIDVTGTNLILKRDTEHVVDECEMTEKRFYVPRTSDIMDSHNSQMDGAFMCTCCGKELHAFEVLKHPVLEVTICKRCKKFYQSGPFSNDEDGAETECRWCGNGGAVILCETCEKVFCQQCIRLNFGEEELQRILKIDWICYCCNMEPLKALTEKFREAGNTNKTASSDVDLPSSSEDVPFFDEDDTTDSDNELEVRRKHRYRKDFPRVIDEIEKADDEISDGGEEKRGCIVNITKDIEEKEVLLPWRISNSLKPHQIEGVQFMWENCIESVSKVKGGDAGNGCILAHNMGLGKTLQVIAFLYAVLKEDLGLRTALIVAPVNVLHNWPEEFQKWIPCNVDPITVFVVDDTIRDNIKRAKLLRSWQMDGGVVIIGYTAFRNLSMGKHIKDKSCREIISQALQNPGPDILVCDEAHMIKNREADITQALKLVKTRRRIALTGSPLQNNLMEYYCMVDFVREGYLGTPHSFKHRFQKPIENGQHADSTKGDVKRMKHRTHILHEQLKPIVQRMGVNVVERDLPSKQVYVISVRLSELQRSLYNRFIEHFWLLKEQAPSIRRSRKCLFNTYHGLSKIWNHPDLLWLAKEERERSSEDSIEDFIIDDDEEISSEDVTDQNEHTKEEDIKSKSKMTKRSDNDHINEITNLDWCCDLISEKQRGVLEFGGKMVLLMDILSMSSAKEEKALVFSQSLSTLNLIEYFLEKLHRHGENGYWTKDEDWYRLDGQTKAKARQKLVHRFNDPQNIRVKCVLISTKAGSLGINLQAANRVIIVDGSWNPTHDLQALFRAWRYGQKKPVVAYRLLAYGTAEEKIYKRQVVKESLAARVLDEQHVGRHSKMEELRVLFKLSDNTNNFDIKGIWQEENSSINFQNDMDVGASGSHSMDKVSLSSIQLSDINDPAPEDDIMTSLLIDHRPRWIVKIHQHERLLEEIEDERLTVEEQALAWQDFNNPDIDSIQMEQSSDYLASRVQNSWTASLLSSDLSFCEPKKHIGLLLGKSIKMGCYVKCDVCNHDVGWEHMTRRKPQVRY